MLMIPYLKQELFRTWTMPKKSRSRTRAIWPKEEKTRNLFCHTGRNKLIRKKLNIDEFGRYKGGLPKNVPYNVAQVRGNSAQMPG